jgi:septin family protein
MYTANKQQNKLVEDCRIHLVLYFLTGPRPKLVDFDHMKEISKYANIIPVISKVKT